METFIDIIAQWPNDAALAEDAGVKPSLVIVWRHRNSIPANRWLEVVRGAAQRRLPVTLEVLAWAAAARPRGAQRIKRPRRPYRKRTGASRRAKTAAAPREAEAQGAAD
ncbi:hypothetical protein [Azospirillum doebereinerae]|uniref:Uncharacterized protein n=1 Tax=Azospirillum doebereinerae TaxID=92933 RepID=A0A3S0WVY4_9PROT|nr:hypothetical protein [Azospirillum doebereinerae]MCG5241892.1 hypothetical protein [Azospirillum doebereinerae]RUQ65168.1 hypothetical protein EJ913_25830 [Azospirillum doebereinerae]